jgi:hypothetical protein
MDAQQQFWLQLAVTALIGIIGIYYTRKQVQLQKPDNQSGAWSKFWPIILMIVLAASSWIPYIIHPDDLPDFPDPHAPVYDYGVTPSECYVSVNGQRFSRYAGHYKLASGCYLYDGNGDILDAPQLQVSRTYDINNSQFRMRIPWGPGFKQYVLTKLPSHLNLVVFLMPVGIDPGQFSTLRQAKALGVRLITAGAAPVVYNTSKP